MAAAGAGQLICDAAERGDVAALGALLEAWSGHDVINFADPCNFGKTALIVGSGEGRVEAVKLLLGTPGETRCCPSSTSLASSSPCVSLQHNCSHFTPTPPLHRHRRQQGAR